MRSSFVALLILTTACSSTPAPMTKPSRSESSRALETIANDYWQHELDENISERSKLGMPLEHLPDVSYAQAEKDADFATSLQQRITALDAAALSEDERVTRGILYWNTRMRIDALPYFWLQFPVTPYATEIVPVNHALMSFAFASGADAARYVHLLDEYPLFINNIVDVLHEEERRGIRLPKVEIPIVKAMIASFKHDPEASVFFVSDERLAAIPSSERAALQSKIRDAIDAHVNRSLQRLLDVFDDAYVAAAPEAVGIGQYPQGAAAYQYLVHLQTTLNLTPEEIHRIGLEEIARINAEMQKVRDGLSFKGSKAEFHQQLRSDPRFFAKSADEVGARLTSYVKKIEPNIPRFFSTLPKAPYDVRRLDPTLEGSMTFGYYQWPTSTDPVGHYLYNGSKLNERPLIFAAGLMCHELIPGHHFQIARQVENNSIPQFRRENYDTAFLEGWGEYAANLGFEMGVYSDPYDRYGRLLMDAMIASRLVVDTGMNALGWSRERASQYLRENTLMSDTEIATETLRYSVDIPAQALAYKLGANQILALRRQAKEQLGPLFDIREFHEWVLGSGSMPMPVLEQHIKEMIKARAM